VVERSNDRVSRYASGVNANALAQMHWRRLTPALLRSPTLSSLRGKRVSCNFH